VVHKGVEIHQAGKSSPFVKQKVVEFEIGMDNLSRKSWRQKQPGHGLDKKLPLCPYFRVGAALAELLPKIGRVVKVRDLKAKRVVPSGQKAM
jgi:hypothetical protein